MTAYKIDSIDTLCSFIITTKPDLNKINHLLWLLGIKAIILDETTPEGYCEQIKSYWQRWQHTRERPIFMGIDIDLAL